MEEVIAKLEQNKFLLVTGASGDGKSSLIFAGLIPNCRAGFFKSQFSKWTVVSFRPERTPLKNMSDELSIHFKKDKEKIEENLQLGYSALVEEYKQSPLFVDINEDAYKILSEENQKEKRRESSNLLIIVDQFEELFTNVENFNKETSTPTHQTQLLNNLILETTRIARKENLPIYIICTMRSDYLGQCAALDGFPELIVESQFYLTRLKRRDIIQVIDEPAMLSGNSITERLMQRLLNDIRAGRDVLPVLQHCLSRIWHAASMGKEEMDLIHYAMVGGMGKEQLPQEDQLLFEEWFIQQPGYKQAYFQNPGLHNVLNIHADELFEKSKLSNSPPLGGVRGGQTQGSIIETVFKCLTKIDDNRAIRNLMTLQEITEMLGKEKYTTEQVAETLKIFREQGNTLIRPFIETEQQTTNHFLQSTTVLDITHEALIRNWKRLEEWSKQEYESVQMYREFRSQLDKWKNNNKQKNYLMSIGSLSYYNDNWFKPQKSNPQSWLKRYMWQEGEEVQDKETKAKEHFEEIKEYLHRSKKNITRKKIFAQVAVAAIVLLLIGVSIGYYRSDQLNKQIQKTSEANRLATRAYMELEKDPTLSFRLAEAAYNVEPTPLSKQVLMAAYGEVPFYMKLEGHTGPVTYARWLPDGDHVVTASLDNTQRIWNIKTMEYKVLKGHKDGVYWGNGNQINYSSNGKYIVTGTRDSTARIWDLEGKCLAILKHDGPVNSAYFSPQPISVILNNPVISNEVRNLLSKNPQGEYLVLTASSDKTARLWDMEGKELVRFEGHEKGLRLAKFSPDGNMIISTAGDKSVRLCGLSGGLLNNLDNFNDQIYDISFSSNGKKFVIGDVGDKVFIFDINAKKEKQLDGHKDVQFSNSDKFIVSRFENLKAKIFDLEKGSEIILQGHTSKLWSLEFSPKEDKVITASDDGTARLWNLEGTELMLFKGHTSQVLSANFSPDGKYVVTASGDGTARVWNVEMKENPVFRGHTAIVMDVDISSNGQLICTAGFDYKAILWKSTGEFVKSLGGFIHYGLDNAKFNKDGSMISIGCNNQVKIFSSKGDSILEVRGHEGSTTISEIIDNKHILISYSNDNSAMLWNFKGKRLQYIKDVKMVDVTSDGEILITVNQDTSIGIWHKTSLIDTNVYEKIKTAKFQKNEISSVDIASNNNYFISTSMDSTAIVWNIKGERLKMLKGFSKAVISCKFSPDNKFILTICQDNTISVWNWEKLIDSKIDEHNLKEATILKGHSDAITDANFSPGGKYIVTASNDNTARVWDLEGNNIITITNHKAAIMKAKFSPDGNYILTASQDQTARLTPWRVEDVLNKINTEKVRGEVWNLKEKDKEVYGIER